MVSSKLVEGKEFRLKRWFQLEKEERSFVIQKFYRHRLLTDDDVDNLLTLDSRNNRARVLFPLFAFAALHYGMPLLFPTQFIHKFSRPQAKMANMALAAAGSYLWYNYNPIYMSLLEEKEKILWKMYNSSADTMMGCNEMIPRWWTESTIHAMLRKSKRQRHAWYSGMFTEPELTGGYLGDVEAIPLWKDPWQISW